MVIREIRSMALSCASAAMVALGIAGCTQAQTCATPLIKGVNLAGPAFAPEVLPGRLNWNYKFPTLAQLQYYKAVGFESVRLSISWERTQPELFGSLDDAYVAEIKKLLDLADSQDMTVVLDLHNYARYRGVVVGSEGVPADALFDIWAKLAGVFKDHPALVAYGLMNEPYKTGGLWNDSVAQRAVDGVRSVDMKHVIYVAGDGFSGTTYWPRLHPVPFVKDPAGKEVYEAHIYFDVNSSGKYADLKPYVDPATLVKNRMAPFTDWLKKFGKTGVITEWGVPTRDADWFDTALQFMNLAQSQCLSTYVWAGGGWSPNYVMSLEPQDGDDKPLINFFRSQFKAPGAQQ
jgi:endoglucanase